MLSQAVTTPSGIRWLVAELPGVEGKALQEAAVQLQASLGDPCAVILAAELDGNASFVAAFSPAVSDMGRLHLTSLVSENAQLRKQAVCPHSWHRHMVGTCYS